MEAFAECSERCCSGRELRELPIFVIRGLSCNTVASSRFSGREHSLCTLYVAITGLPMYEYVCVCDDTV